MNAKTLFIFFTAVAITLLVSFVVEANRNEAEASTASLNCVGQTTNSVTLQYSLSSGTAQLFRGRSTGSVTTRLQGLSSASNRRISIPNLSSGTTYYFTLRSGSSATSSRMSGVTRCSTRESTTSAPRTTPTPTTTTTPTPTPTTTTTPTPTPTTRTTPTRRTTPTPIPRTTPAPTTTTTPTPTFTPAPAPSPPEITYPTYTRASAPTFTPDPTPEGKLECKPKTEDSIALSYSVKDGTSASLFRNTIRLKAIGSGDNSGSFVVEGLSSGATYTFYLRNGLFSYSDRIDRAICTTKIKKAPETEPEPKEEISVTKRVKSLEREVGYVNSLNSLPGESIGYSVKVTAGDAGVRNVTVRDRMEDEKIKYDGNLRVDGDKVFGDIDDGINIGSIDGGDHKEITFDAKVASREEFSTGTTSIANVAEAISGDATDTGKATVHIAKEDPVAPPTDVPTGITGSGIIDYLFIPFLAISGAFLLFRKQIVALWKKLEEARGEVVAEWV